MHLYSKLQTKVTKWPSSPDDFRDTFCAASGAFGRLLDTKHILSSPVLKVRRGHISTVHRMIDARYCCGLGHGERQCESRHRRQRNRKSSGQHPKTVLCPDVVAATSEPRQIQRRYRTDHLIHRRRQWTVDQLIESGLTVIAENTAIARQFDFYVNFFLSNKEKLTFS